MENKRDEMKLTQEQIKDQIRKKVSNSMYDEIERKLQIKLWPETVADQREEIYRKIRWTLSTQFRQEIYYKILRPI